MKSVTVHLPESYIADLEELVKQDKYPNKSEAIRIAIRDMIKMELYGNGQPFQADVEEKVIAKSPSIPS